MYLVNNMDQIHITFNESKKSIFSYIEDRKGYQIILFWHELINYEPLDFFGNKNNDTRNAQMKVANEGIVSLTKN
jgi:hypothetical protein